MAVSRYASERYPDATAVALGAIALGQPIADTLQDRYPTMSRSVAVQFARTVGSSGAARELRSAAPTTAANAGISADRVTVDTGLPIQAEYTVIYTIEDSAGQEYRIPVVITHLPAGASEEEILAAADAAASLLTEQDYPQYEEEIAEAQSAGSTVASVDIVRVRINPIH